MNLKEKLQLLSERDKKLLRYAFQNNLEQIVLIPDSPNYLGVNMKQTNASFEEKERNGVWSFGIVNRGVPNGL